VSPKSHRRHVRERTVSSETSDPDDGYENVSDEVKRKSWRLFKKKLDRLLIKKHVSRIWASLVMVVWTRAKFSYWFSCFKKHTLNLKMLKLIQIFYQISLKSKNACVWSTKYEIMAIFQMISLKCDHMTRGMLWSRFTVQSPPKMFENSDPAEMEAGLATPCRVRDRDVGPWIAGWTFRIYIRVRGLISWAFHYQILY